MPLVDEERAFLRQLERRTFLRRAAAGTALVALGGGLYVLADDRDTRRARAQRLPDGRPRLPPGQRVIHALRPMGGDPGDPTAAGFRLRVHGEVRRPFTLDFRGLLALGQVDHAADVHCVTGWSVLGALWRGVRVADLAARAALRPAARYLIFEAAWGYTANVPLSIALADDTMVVHRMNGDPLARANGAPVRALVPQLYFWKSAKWLRGLRFSRENQPGYWERRGYHDLGDPWREQRYG